MIRIPNLMSDLTLLLRYELFFSKIYSKMRGIIMKGTLNLYVQIHKENYFIVIRFLDESFFYYYSLFYYYLKAKCEFFKVNMYIKK